MINPGESLILGLFAGLSLSMIIAVVAGASVRDFPAEAVSRGYALYCPLSGEFAWKGECDD